MTRIRTLLIALVSFIVGCASTIQTGTAHSCGSSDLLAEILKTPHEWLLLLPADRRADGFNPVARIRSSKGKVWVATFRSDYFPVRATSTPQGVFLEGLTFIRPSPNGSNPDDGDLAKFGQADVRYALRAPSCNGETQLLTLEVTVPGTQAQTYVFSAR